MAAVWKVSWKDVRMKAGNWLGSCCSSPEADRTVAYIYESSILRKLSSKNNLGKKKKPEQSPLLHKIYQNTCLSIRICFKRMYFLP